MIKFKIHQWAGSKGIGITFGKYSVTVHPHILADYKMRKYLPMRNWKEYIFAAYKNRRTSINEWDRDYVLFGIMLQIQKYKSYMYS